MATTTKKSPKKRSNQKDDFLPPSADVVHISGRDYVIAPLDEYNEWREDLALAALITDRLKDDGPYMTLEELEKRLDKKDKGRKK